MVAAIMALLAVSTATTASEVTLASTGSALSADMAPPAASPSLSLGPSRQRANPWIAAGLSAGTPLVIGAVTAGLGVATNQLGVAGSGAYIWPIGLGAGQVYAGDPLRGGLVAIGGLAVYYGGLGILAASTQLPQIGNTPAPFYMAIPVVIGEAVYVAWAAWDAAAVASK